MGRKRSLYAKAITFLTQGFANTLHRGETKRGQRGNKHTHVWSNAGAHIIPKFTFTHKPLEHTFMQKHSHPVTLFTFSQKRT